MRGLGNKLLLFLICSYLLLFVGIHTTTVMACMLAITVSGLCTYWDASRQTALFLLLYTGGAVLVPVFGIFLPLLLYDALSYRQYKTLLMVAAGGIASLFRLPTSLFIPLVFAFIVSLLLALYSQQIQTLRENLHQVRDRSTEAEIASRERNQALIEKQNYEIHAATLSERNRIAREIHDNVGHMLTRSILQTGALKVINKDPVLDEPLSTLSDTLNTAMTSIRASVHDLHDESIDLRYVLKDLVEKTKQPPITLDYDVENNVPKEMKYAFISIVKEAIQNIQKHSNATKAQITLREHPGMYHMQIRDNGTNIPQTLNHEGMGLSNMEERVHALGGNIQIDTNNGFCITISIIK